MTNPTVGGPTSTTPQHGVAEATTTATPTTEGAKPAAPAKPPRAPKRTKLKAIKQVAAEVTHEPAAAPTRNVSVQTEALLLTIADRKSSPADVLKTLANLTPSGNGQAVRQFHTAENRRQLQAVLSHSKLARKVLTKRLKSTQMEALKQAAREGVGLTSVKDRKLTTQALRDAVANIDLLKDALGIDAKPKKPSKKELKKAQSEVTKFVKGFDQSLVRKSGKVAADKLGGIKNKLITTEGQRKKQKFTNVCKDFHADVRSSFVIIEDRQGQRSWLSPSYNEGIDSATNRATTSDINLAKFAKDDPDKTKLLSQLLTKAATNAASLDALREAGIELLMPDGKPASQAEGPTKHIFVLKENDDGSHTLKVTVEQQVEKISTYDEAAHADVDEDEGPEADSSFNCNSSQSTLATEMTINIGTDNSVEVADVSYQMRITTADASGVHRTPSRTTELESIGNRFGVPPENDFLSLGADLTEAKKLGGPDSNLEELSAHCLDLLADDAVNGDQYRVLESRIEFLQDARNQLAQMDSVPADNAEAYLEQMSNLNSDIKLVQQDLAARAAVWINQAPPEHGEAIATTMAALTVAYSDTAEQIQDVATDTQAALDELQGNFDQVVTGALSARAQFAQMQAQANSSVYGAIAQKAGEFIGTVPVQDTVSPLCAEIASRSADIAAKIDDYESGVGPLPEFGPGAKGRQLKKLTAQIEKQLDKNEKLPASHPQLSEAQLVEIRVNHFLKKHPDSQLNQLFDNREFQFKKAMVKELSNGDWGPVEKTLHDVDSQGRIHTLKSKIVPASSMDNVPSFIHYGGAGGVPSSSRAQVDHAVNLASTTLTNAKGEVMFSGLRHGIMDATAITPKYLVEEASNEEIKSYITGALEYDDRWHDLIEDNDYARGIDMQVGLVKNPENAERIATWIRENANINAATELVAAAVNSDPALVEQAVNNPGQPITLNLNSISLVTPDVFRSGNKSEKVMQANQEAALRTLASGDPVSVHVRDSAGNLVEAKVDVGYLPFNFAVNGPGVGDSPVQRIVRTAAVRWRAMDEQNRQSLDSLIGDVSKPELGGEVGRVLAHLEGGELDRPLTQTQVRALAADGPINSAFADPQKRANAIRTLATQVKEIFNSGNHRVAGKEPYKMASRLALLSHLLGDTTAFNCKSGKDRTGQLDAEVKLLASTLADGDGTNVPRPNTVPDPIRKTNFVLNTGQLEMQEKNTGLRGFKLKIPSSKAKGKAIAFTELTSLGKQFNTKTAQRLYNGDSKFVSS